VSGWASADGWRWRKPSSGEVWLWLNHRGSGLIWGNAERFILKPGMYALTGGGEVDDWTCIRYPGLHQLELVTFTHAWLIERLGRHREWLHPALAKWLGKGENIAFCGLMGVWERDLCEALARAAIEPGAPRLLAEAAILNWAAVRLFRSAPGDAGAGFCQIIKSKDPVRRAIDILRTRVDQPLDLTTLAREVGIAPHHLSRKVGAETGLTLQRHLRRLRIERACEALASRRFNVTEAALDCGYQSLSHFAKSFREETGLSPAQWLADNRKSSN
jgi:AraC-like DNA-binding protein